MSRIAILFIGGVRECLGDISRNIITLQNDLVSHHTHTFFSTWFPEAEPYNISGSNYCCDYSIPKLQEQLTTVNTVMFHKQKRLSEYATARNSYPPMFTYQLMEVAKSFRLLGENYDYIVKTRHDNLFSMKNIEKYFTDDFSVLPLYWVHGRERDYSMVNDHFFITSFNTFMKYADLSDDVLKEYCSHSHNCEQSNAITMSSMSNVRFVDESDIVKYSNKNLPERRFIGF